MPKGPEATGAADPVAELAERFRSIADSDFRGYSPVYEHLARQCADDPGLCAFIEHHARRDARRGRLPVLFLASVHDLVLAGRAPDLEAVYRGGSAADPWPTFRALVDAERPAIAERLATRSVQTNEVGRSLLLALALAELARTDDRPVALVEIGPSAGLNLLLDRYDLGYVADGAVVATAGDPASAVPLRATLVGPHRPPVPVDLPRIATRTGVDPAPVDVTDPDARRWLRACVWPGQAERDRDLAAALELAVADPPPLVRGDAVTDLGGLVDAVPDDVVPVVLSTWALAYVAGEGRRAVLDALDTRGAARDLALVSFEEPRLSPWVPAAPDDLARAAGGTPSVLGLRQWRAGRVRTRALAHAQPHGRRIAWADDPGR